MEVSFYTLDELNMILLAMGFPNIKSHITDEIVSPIHALINYNISVKPYLDTLIEYSKKLKYKDNIIIARILSDKGLDTSKIVPFLLSLYKECPIEDIDKLDLWAVGNSLASINKKESYNEIFEICKDKRYGTSRQMLMSILSKMTNRQDVYEFLIESLYDNTIKAHVIEAIGKYGNISAIPILESLEVKKGLYEFKAITTALNRLYKLK